MGKTLLLEMDTTNLVQFLLNEPDAGKRVAYLEENPASLELVEALKSEVDRHKDSDSAKALLAGERAVEAAEYAAEPKARAIALWAQAVGLTVHGNFSEAIPMYEKARAGFQALGLTEDATRTAVRQIQALAMMGDMAGALALAEGTRAVFTGLGLMQDAGMTSINMGIIFYRMGRISEAEAALKEALEQFSSVGDEVNIAKVHHNLAYAYQEQDRYKEAIEHFQKALALFRKLGNTQYVAGTSTNIALLYRKEGRLKEALDLLSRVRALYGSKLEDNPDMAFTQLEEARIHLDLNLLSEAEKLAQELVGIFEARGMQLERAEALMTLGSAQAKASKLQAAQQTLQQAREGWLGLGNAIQAALVDISISTLLLELGRKGNLAALEQAALLVGSATQALIEVPSAKALGLSVLAEVLLDLGNCAVAKQHLQEAARLAANLGIPDLSIRIERLLGQLALAEQQPESAEQYFKAAIQRLESVRVSLTVDEFKSAYLGDKLEVYGDVVDLLLDKGRNHEAFDYAERAKSRALLDLLARSGEVQEDQDPEIEGLQRELAQARQELNRQFLVAEAEAADALRVIGGPKLEEAEARVTGLVRELQRRRGRASIHLNLENQDAPVPGGPGLQANTDLLKAPDIRLDHIQRELPQGAVLLEYFSTRQGLVAFVIDQHQVQVVRGLGTSAQVQQIMEQLEFYLHRVPQGGQYMLAYSPQALKQSVDGQLRAMYDQLIKPLDLKLKGQPLIIVPHGSLHAVPFAALYDGEYLIDKAEVSLAPSAAVYTLCCQRSKHSRGPLVAFGVPVENIPQVLEEVEGIIQIADQAHKFTGQAASMENFFVSAPEAQVLHVATHGAFRPDNPMFSGLRMADGWLTARDLYNLRLSAELVVLSACETGLAKQANGDELLGLARGFLYAGAPCLVASLWPVKDDTTARFMTNFYARLHQASSVASALREAQLELRQQHPNPYYWAAFTLTGDPQRTVVI